MASRAELEAALDDGCTVDVGGRQFRTRAELPQQQQGAPPVEGIVFRDAQGKLTREGMELVIARGGSVLLAGTESPITHKDELPSAAELARGDERRSASVRSALLQQQAQIQAQLNTLDETRPQAPPGAFQQQPSQPQQPAQQPPRPAPRATRPQPPKEE
jgi:hypothetical protein